MFAVHHYLSALTFRVTRPSIGLYQKYSEAAMNSPGSSPFRTTDTIWTLIFKRSLNYLLDICNLVVHLLRWPIAFLICCWICTSFVTMAAYTLTSAFQPLCYLPLVSQLGFCNTTTINKEKPAAMRADFTALVNMQTDAFGRLMEESIGGSSLSLYIMKAELATMDLSTLVSHSNLTNREELSQSLRSFVGHAQTTGRGLQKFDAKVGGAVDRCERIMYL